MLADGVETVEQFEVLRGYGCELAQGHLFSESTSSDRATALLREGRWPSAFIA
jgi:EAL domain-containing protein (putative c-di-GMP-specific phosphodiesterase class I)